MTIAGIVLAAGLSERMEGGVPKQLLAFGDHTMAGLVVAMAEGTTLDPIVVVTGYQADEVQATMAPRRARVTRNPEYETGNPSSLRAGLAAVGKADAVMLLLGDMPGVGIEIIETVAAAWEQLRPFAAVSSYEGVIGHPFVLSSAAAAEAAALDGTKPLWAWLNEVHAADLIEVELGRAKPRDINTVADYHAELRDQGLWEHTTGRKGGPP